jgi:hypothetical protein
MAGEVCGLRKESAAVARDGSLDEHAIAIRVEPVSLANGVLVCVQDPLSAGEG